MVQESQKYRISEEENKEEYLKYFFGEKALENQKQEEDSLEADKKTCIYCGSTRVPQNSHEAFEVCGNCCAQLLCSGQEFEEVLYQTKENLERLMGVSIHQSVSVVYKNGWWSQHKHYFGKGGKDNSEKKEKDDFIESLISVPKPEKNTDFVVYEKMPRSIFMYLIAKKIIEIFLEKKTAKPDGSQTSHPVKCAVIKWCALRYMELSGYTDFYQCKNQEELKDTEYKRLVEEIESDLEASDKSMDKIVEFLKNYCYDEEREGTKEKEGEEEISQPQEEGDGKH